MGSSYSSSEPLEIKFSSVRWWEVSELYSYQESVSFQKLVSTHLNGKGINFLSRQHLLFLGESFVDNIVNTFNITRIDLSHFKMDIIWLNHP